LFSIYFRPPQPGIIIDGDIQAVGVFRRLVSCTYISHVDQTVAWQSLSIGDAEQLQPFGSIQRRDREVKLPRL